jgi:hypothetical protein
MTLKIDLDGLADQRIIVNDENLLHARSGSWTSLGIAHPRNASRCGSHNAQATADTMATYLLFDAARLPTNARRSP